MAGNEGETTSEQLVRAAASAFAERGYEGARLSDIAEAAGFTTGAVYAHFDGKADLLAAVIAQEGDRLLGQVLGRDSDDEPTTAVLRELLVGTLAGRRSPVQRVLADAFAVASRDADVEAALLPELEQVRELLRSLLSRAQAEHELDSTVPVTTLAHFGVTLMVGGLILRAMDSPRPPRSEVEVFVNQLVERFGPGRVPAQPA